MVLYGYYMAWGDENDSGIDIISIANAENEVHASIAQKVGQEQIHGLLFGDTLSWQQIIYDLINTEQLDPWDIDLGLLAAKFLEKVKLLEEANFFVSSKVLFAASLLLRIKSEILLEEDVKGLDDILYGRKDEKKYHQERLELDEEIPELLVRTPLPRFKKVTLEQLMKALDTAINTETRRIKRVVLTKQQEFETSLSLPKTRINIQDKIREVHGQLKGIFEKRDEKLPFSDISGETKESRIGTFVPLLHLDNQQKVWLEQEGHCEEIWILLKKMYEEKNKEELARLKAEVEAEIGESDSHLIDDPAFSFDKAEEGEFDPEDEKKDLINRNQAGIEEVDDAEEI